MGSAYSIGAPNTRRFRTSRLHYGGEQNGQINQLSTSGWRKRQRLSRGERPRRPRARHRRDPGVVGTQRSDSRRRRQAGGGRVPGPGAGSLSRQGGARGEGSRTSDEGT